MWVICALGNRDGLREEQGVADVWSPGTALGSAHLSSRLRRSTSTFPDLPASCTSPSSASSSLLLSPLLICSSSSLSQHATPSSRSPQYVLSSPSATTLISSLHIFCHRGAVARPMAALHYRTTPDGTCRCRRPAARGELSYLVAAEGAL